MEKKLEAVKVEEGNVITLPKSVTSSMGIKAGSYFIVNVNPEYKEVILHAVPNPNKRLAEIRVELANTPGALARFSNALGNAKVNIEGGTLTPASEKKTVAIFTVDMANATRNKEELSKDCKKGGALLVEIRALNL